MACGVVLKTNAPMMSVMIASIKRKLNVPTTTYWSLISLRSIVVTVTLGIIRVWFVQVLIVTSRSAWSAV